VQGSGPDLNAEGVHGLKAPGVPAES